jgi:hypothetical protein
VAETALKPNRANSPLKSKAENFDGSAGGFRPSDEIFCAYKSALGSVARDSDADEAGVGGHIVHPIRYDRRASCPRNRARSRAVDRRHRRTRAGSDAGRSVGHRHQMVAAEAGSIDAHIRSWSQDGDRRPREDGYNGRHLRAPAATSPILRKRAPLRG